MGVSGQRQARALPPGKGPPVPFEASAGLDTEAREKIILPVPGIEPRSLGRPARSQAPILTKLHNQQ
jgi:hypothetical protein